MSIFAAVREQHPDWDDDTVYKETNLIYAEKNLQMQVVDPSKPVKQSTVITGQTEEPEENDGEDAEKDLQDEEAPEGEEQADE